MRLIPESFKNEISIRIEKIQNEMQKSDCQTLLIGSNPNIYYCSGNVYRGYVFIPQVGKPLWFVIKPQTYDKSPDLFFIRKPEDIPQILRELNVTEINSIGLEENELSYVDIIRLKNLFTESKLINGSPILKNARKIKTLWEINEMRIDGYHHAKVYEKVKDCYKPGMTDLQLQIEIERHLRLEGSIGISRVAGNFMEINLGSVISGDNADHPGPYEFTMGGSGNHPALPVGADNSLIKDGQTVMIDMNGAFNGYQTDMTRVWSLGETSELAYKAHNCSIDILRCLEKISLPGLPVKKLYETALEIVAEKNLNAYFMGHESQVSFIGHGIGIELNELPVINSKSKDILEAGMTLAIEPKFVIPHVGAVGVENTYVVTEKGLENLTVFPEEIQMF